MRVLYIHHLPDLGGAPTSLLLLIKEMKKKPDVNLRVLCPDGPVLSLFKEKEIEVFPVPISGFYHTPGNCYKGSRWLLFVRELLRLLPNLIALYRHIRLFRPDIVHLNEVVLIPAGILCKILRVPVVWHIRAVLEHGLLGIRRRIILWILRNVADRVIAISGDVASDYEGIPATVVHNSVDPNQFDKSLTQTEARQQLGVPNEHPVVTMVERIDPIKGSYDLVRIAYLVKQQFPDVKFVIAGDGLRGERFFKSFKGRIIKLLGIVEDRVEKFKKLIRNYKVDSNFLILGHVDDVQTVYTASDVEVFPSYLRSISRAGLEVATAGIPMVASTVHWNNDIVRNGETGFLFQQGDIKDAVDKIIQLLEDPELRKTMGQNARNHAMVHFNPEKNADKIYQIYCQILEIKNHQSQLRIKKSIHDLVLF